ncbi:CRP-like protein Clp [Neorhodopirellula pilleata]|uniref:CRP-like protein Clp n=2 Tax=Neorhodopirellula pilleata TaxID=2714738 RepID=A0A5C6AB89_9BACT|nr:CRP-like protein Clp [Neorhodopirellula pilleata]
MVESQIQWFRKIPAFGGLRAATLQWIQERSVQRMVAQGEFFFREGDPGESLYVMVSGAAEVIRMRGDQSVTLGVMGVGDCFGEMSLIDFCSRSASVVARTDCEAIEVARSTLGKLYRENAEEYAIIMMNLGREVSRRLRKADDRLFMIDRDGFAPSV